MWLFGESQSSRGPSVIVGGILIRCSKTCGGMSVECPPAAVLGEATIFIVRLFLGLSHSQGEDLLFVMFVFYYFFFNVLQFSFR